MTRSAVMARNRRVASATVAPAAPKSAAAPLTGETTRVVKSLRPTNSTMLSGGAVLLLLQGAMGMTELYNPEIVTEASTTPCFAKDSCILLVRFNGLFQFLAVAMVWSVMDAINEDVLASSTYGRLMIGISLSGAAQLLALYLSSGAVQPTAFMGGLWTAALYSTIFGLYMYHVTQKGGILSAVSVGGFVKRMKTQGLVSTGYASLVLSSLAAGALFLFNAASVEAELFPATQHNPFVRMMLRQAGASLFAVAPAAYALKNAYDHGRIWATTYKNLNFGVAALFGGTSWILGIATSADLIRITLPTQWLLWSTTVIGFMGAYQYMFAEDPEVVSKRKAQEAEEDRVAAEKQEQAQREYEAKCEAARAATKAAVSKALRKEE